MTMRSFTQSFFWILVATLVLLLLPTSSMGNTVRMPMTSHVARTESTVRSSNKIGIPAENTFNLLFSVPLTVGKTSQGPFHVQVDTGSDVLWIPGVSCTTPACKHDTHRFDPSISGYSPESTFSLQYGKGSCSGDYYAVPAHVGGLEVSEMAVGIASVVDHDMDHPGMDGIMGLSPHAVNVDSSTASFFDALINEHKLAKRVFFTYFDIVPGPIIIPPEYGPSSSSSSSSTTGGGESSPAVVDESFVMFGGIDTSVLESPEEGLHVVESLSDKAWIIEMDSVTTSSIPIPTCHNCKTLAIMDTGTSAILAPPKAMKALSEAVPTVPPDCVLPPDLPVLEFVIDGKTYGIPPEALFLVVENPDGSRDCGFAIAPIAPMFDNKIPDGVEPWLFGVPFFQQFATSWDLSHRSKPKFGFATSISARPLPVKLPDSDKKHSLSTTAIAVSIAFIFGAIIVFGVVSILYRAWKQSLSLAESVPPCFSRIPELFSSCRSGSANNDGYALAPTV